MTKPFKEIANIKNLTRQEWLNLRKSYIGGSEAGAIAGLNPWASPASVWLSKTSEIAEDLDNERMRIGRDLEDYVAQRFSEATGKKVRRNNHMMVSCEWPWMLADIDREVVGEDSLLECKTTGSYSKLDWQDGQVPPHYYAQVQHYLAVTGKAKGYIAVLIGNEQFLWYEIERDEEYIASLAEIERAFYEKSMVAGGFPEPDGSQAYSSALRERFSTSDGSQVRLDGLDDVASEYVAIKAKIKELEQESKEYEQKIQLAMGDAEKGETEDFQFTWKTVTTNRFDKKRFEEDHPELAESYYYQSAYRRFSVK